jgi:hypothetical protein
MSNCQGRKARALSFALRSDRSLRGVAPEVRSVIARVGPQLAASQIRLMDEIVSGPVRQPRLSAVLLSGFSLSALLLAAMGLCLRHPTRCQPHAGSCASTRRRRCGAS